MKSEGTARWAQHSASEVNAVITVTLQMRKLRQRRGKAETTEPAAGTKRFLFLMLPPSTEESKVMLMIATGTYSTLGSAL